MSFRLVRADKLQAGDVLALPFGKTATLREVHVGSTYVNVKLVDLPKTRYDRFQEVAVVDNEGSRS